VPKLTDEERATIFDNLLHDLAVLDPTTEEEALAISERLFAEGRIDPAKTVDAHRRLLARLRAKSELKRPQALATGGAVARGQAAPGLVPATAAPSRL
jgi:hypothetical protein